MHFQASTIFIAVSLLFSAVIGAIFRSFDGEVVERHNPDDQCHSNLHGVNDYNISLTDDRSIDVDCGRGILDNVRGRCADGVTNWGCDYSGDTGAIIHFTTVAECTPGDVSAAIYAAGGPQLVCG